MYLQKEEEEETEDLGFIEKIIGKEWIRIK
jgi:hypothetical protein